MTDLLQIALAAAALLAAQTGRTDVTALALLAYAWLGTITPPPGPPLMPELIRTIPFRMEVVR